MRDSLELASHTVYNSLSQINDDAFENLKNEVSTKASNNLK